MDCLDANSSRALQWAQVLGCLPRVAAHRKQRFQPQRQRQLPQRQWQLPQRQWQPPERQWQRRRQPQQPPHLLPMLAQG